MFEYKPDFSKVLERYEAWWDCQIIDRPLVSMTFPQPPSQRLPAPSEPDYGTLRKRWLDTEMVVARAQARMANTCFYADALPIVWPNLGPEVFSSLYGCELEFSATTSWSVPVQQGWDPDSVAALRLDLDSFYHRKLLEITDALLDAARGRFIVGYTDMHPGADALAAFRDPQQLCLDMIDHADEISALVERITDEFLQVYDLFYHRLAAAGMPSTTWLPATCRGRYHVPSNDFSCMISDTMFEQVFLPGIIRECEHMDRCIYHLDGPQALRFLDALLEIPQIHAIQWVAGAGRDHWRDSVAVYQRIQQQGKAFCVSLGAQELDQLFEVLRPEGAWLLVGGIGNEEQAAATLEKISRWGR
jgi:hypothetical protein